MDDRKVRDLVKGWQVRAGQEADVVTKFVFLWFCFNAWLAFESRGDRDTEMINWLTGPHGTTSQLQAAFDLAARSNIFVGYLQALADLSPIIGTGRRRREVLIDSSDNFASIVKGIYQVRCNLFHGGKSVDSTRDEKLVTACGAILEEWIGNLEDYLKVLS